jgi:hypothetical protein
VMPSSGAMEWSALPSPVVGLERLARVMGTVTLSMLGMLIAHCGGYQMAQLVPGNRPSGPAPALAEAMHGGHGGHAAHARPGGSSVLVQPDLDGLTARAGGGHDHLVPMASGGLLVLAGAMLVVVVVRRRWRIEPPRLTTLLAVQVGMFVLMDGGERVLSGVDLSAMFGERRVLLALALQVPLAMAVTALGRRVAELVAAILERATAWPRRWPDRSRWVSERAQRVVRPHAELTAAPRGPPFLGTGLQSLI